MNCFSATPTSYPVRRETGVAIDWRRHDERSRDLLGAPQKTRLRIERAVVAKDNLGQPVQDRVRQLALAVGEFLKRGDADVEIAREQAGMALLDADAHRLAENV